MQMDPAYGALIDEDIWVLVRPVETKIGCLLLPNAQNSPVTSKQLNKD
jgi:hypothetical protein